MYESHPVFSRHSTSSFLASLLRNNTEQYRTIQNSSEQYEIATNMTIFHMSYDEFKREIFVKL